MGQCWVWCGPRQEQLHSMPADSEHCKDLAKQAEELIRHSVPEVSQEPLIKQTAF